MKKIYLALLPVLMICFTSKAQLTLTKAANEPVPGDADNSVGYDSTGVIPKNTGANQTWNFSSMVQNTVSVMSTYTTASSVPQSTLFSGATLAQDYGNGTYQFYKSTVTPSQFEVLGLYDGFTTISYSNSLVGLSWPFTFGSSFSDTYAGTYSGLFSGSLTGTVNVVGTGTGTIILPNGMSFTNILQEKTIDRTVLNLTSPIALTPTAIGTYYAYFHASQKNPLLIISYSISDDGSNKDTSVIISMNSQVITALSNLSTDAGFELFPNPAKNAFRLNLDNTGSEPCVVRIYDATGRLLKTQDLGRTMTIRQEISISTLDPGIYNVITSLGPKNIIRRLVIN